jgi:hypothetical protein
MPSRFTLPHLDISARVATQDYAGDGSRNTGAVRIREEHGRRVQNELRVALEAADQSRPVDERLPAPMGAYVEVELRRGTAVDKVELKSEGIRAGAAKATDGNTRTIALYVPDHARPILEQILDEYLNGDLTPKGKNPPNKNRVESIEAIRTARIGTLWTDPKPIPGDPQQLIWWGLWCYKEKETVIEEMCARLNVRAANRDRRLYFPEIAVVPVLASRTTIELMMFATDAIAELRLANDTPVFFTDDVKGEQHEWVDALAERIIWPGADAPAVCVLDTGVNRAHALIEPALSPNDLHTLNDDWDSDDQHPTGHGTSMAGMALHGDLTAALGDDSERSLSHRIESVKLLPPDGFDANQPQSYGVLTQAAIVLPEIEAPERNRVYCMAITNEDVSGATASAWSAAIDQAAAGRMIADNDNDNEDENGDEEANRPKRLIILSGGNVAAETDNARRQPQDNYPIEDPAQAWNALTVGGYTDLIDIHDRGYETWTPVVEAGELSPHSRTSVTWPQGLSPFKPELVMEAGNRAVSPGRTEVLTLSSLSLLSTGSDVVREPLVAFDATSAAAAQAARMAARLSAAHPDYWPETIRALMVHSAEWTQPMLTAFNDTPLKRGKYELVRRFGYGVPDFDRANASANNHLALVAQAEIQPFRSEGSRKFNECHYYDLPIPPDMLERLENEPIELKVTLSYFIDPNPGLSANVDAQRYQSHGLRFDLQRRNESIARFKHRVNAFERDNPRRRSGNEPADPKWLLGDDSISAGSLHCDVWQGRAIELLQRNTLCIKPVNGWWRNRASTGVCNRKTRYALVVTLKTANVDLDIYTPVSALVLVPVSVETTV